MIDNRSVVGRSHGQEAPFPDQVILANAGIQLLPQLDEPAGVPCPCGFPACSSTTQGRFAKLYVAHIRQKNGRLTAWGAGELTPAFD